MDKLLKYPQQATVPAIVLRLYLSLRTKRSNLVFNKNKELKIASSQRSLLAMTEQAFFTDLLELRPEREDHVPAVAVIGIEDIGAERRFAIHDLRE